MSASDVDDWAQTDTPIDATAIFPPDQVPGSGTPSSYSRAKIHYLNGSGREVNTALPGAHITTSEYDEHHNVIRILTAANRQRALATTDSAARAREIDTQNTYDPTGLELREPCGTGAPSAPSGVWRPHSVHGYCIEARAEAKGP